MKVTLCVIVGFVAALYCNVIADAKKQYGYKQAHGHENQGFGHETAYGYKTESHDKDDHYSKTYHGNDHYRNDYRYEVEHRHGIAYNEQHIYHGIYGGHCDKDGFYYKDDYSFVICSNNNAYVQPCAPGSRNSGHGRYNYGDNYYYRDFCDVNLVDHGYGAKGYYDYHGAHSQYGYEHDNKGNRNNYANSHNGPSYRKHEKYENRAY